jgi:hypothetical protein
LAPLPEEVVAQYLAILGVVRREPSLGALRELLAAHLTRIPFENISQRYYQLKSFSGAVRPLGFSELQTPVERRFLKTHPFRVSGSASKGKKVIIAGVAGRDFAGLDRTFFAL